MNDEQLIHSIILQSVGENDDEKNSVISHPIKREHDINYADGNITSSSGISNDLPRYNDPIKQREI